MHVPWVSIKTHEIKSRASSAKQNTVNLSLFSAIILLSEMSDHGNNHEQRCREQSRMNECIRNNRDLIIDGAQVGDTLLQILPPLVQAFTSALQRVVDETIEQTSALNDEHLKLTSQAKSVHRSLRAAVKDALPLVEKIDEFATIVLKRNNVTQTEQDVRKQNYSSLTELVMQISVCLNRAAEMHTEF